MPKALLIVPWADAKGNPHAAGEEVDLSDEEYASLRLDGKVGNIEPQEPPTHFGDVTQRPDVQGTTAEQPPRGARNKR